MPATKTTTKATKAAPRTPPETPVAEIPAVPETPDRFSRFSGIIDPTRLLTSPVLIVGCGGIGRPISLALGSMGVFNQTLYDHDTIEDGNRGTQGWPVDSTGRKKVDQLRSELLSFFDEDEWEGHPLAKDHAFNVKAKATKYVPIGNEDYSETTVFLCVDSMQARRTIVDALIALPKPPSLIIDTRMAAQVCTLISVTPNNFAAYNNHWFPDADAAPETCTTRSTLYCAAMASSLAISQFIRHLRGMPLPVRIDTDLFSHIMNSK